MECFESGSSASPYRGNWINLNSECATDKEGRDATVVVAGNGLVPDSDAINNNFLFVPPPLSACEHFPCVAGEQTDEPFDKLKLQPPPWLL